MPPIIIRQTPVSIPAEILSSRPYAREATYLMNYANSIGETEYSLAFRDYVYNGNITLKMQTAAGTLSILKGTDQATRIRASRLRRFCFKALH